MSSSTHPWPNLTKTTHRTEYAAISPLNPANSHAGKTVVVTAGATGVGLFISRGFLRAGARTVALLARREAVLAEAAAGLRDEFGEKSSDDGAAVDKVLTYAVDITDEDRVNDVFADVRRRINSDDGQANGEVKLRRDIDVLVLSAAYVDHGLPVLGYTQQSLRASFETNVLGNLNVVRAFVPEAAYMPVADMSGEVRAPVRTAPPPPSLATPPTVSPSSPSTSSSDRVIIAIADVMSYTLFPTQSLYGASKLPFHTFMLRHLDAELRQLSATSSSTSRRPVRAHALHPGALLTPAGLDIGFTEQMFPWDDPSLPGGFATWLASDAGRFLRGRFVHATWDVEELVAMRGRFEEDADLAEVVLKV